MNIPRSIEQTSSALLEKGADSVFVYGSRARGDDVDGSDWEIGAIFKEDAYVSRSELTPLRTEGTVIYPFKREELEKGVAATPFTQSIWLTEIILVGKTIGGEDILPTLALPVITPLDLFSEAVFSKARSLDAMLAQREGAPELARDMFVKSTLLGARALILSAGLPFPRSYPEIAEQAAILLKDDVRHVPALALEVRNTQRDITAQEAFENIDMQDSIEQTIRTNIK